MNPFEKYKNLVMKAPGISLAIFLFIILLFILPNAPEQTQEQIHENTQQQAVSVATKQPVANTEISLELNLEDEPEASSTESPEAQESVREAEIIKTSQPPQTPNPASATYLVVNVVDGDTVKLNMEGKVETVRLIGIDTPETVHPSKPVECFGIEASNKAKEVLSGKRVSLETDASQGTRDRYGRLLGYVILSDGTNFNKMMIEQGFAYEYTYATPYKYQSAFKAAQSSAEANQRGLWASGACEDPQEEQTASTPSNSGNKWYTSSHHSAKYYYHESCGGWQGLSPTYLKMYDSETALRADHPAHTLHPECSLN